MAVARALAAGGHLTGEVENHDYGDRQGGVRDQSGTSGGFHSVSNLVPIENDPRGRLSQFIEEVWP